MAKVKIMKPALPQEMVTTPEPAPEPVVKKKTVRKRKRK